MGAAPITKSRVVNIMDVNGFHSMMVFMIPSFGTAYTTGVTYINKPKPIVIIFAMSLYNIPMGVINNPRVVPNTIAPNMAIGNSNKLE